MQDWQVILAVSVVFALLIALDLLMHRRWLREHRSAGTLGHAFLAFEVSHRLRRIRSNYPAEARRRYLHHPGSDRRLAVREQAQARCKQLRTDRDNPAESEAPVP